jgi:hypothetical protein
MKELRAPGAVSTPEPPAKPPAEPAPSWRHLTTAPDGSAASLDPAQESAFVDKRRDPRVPLLLPVITATIDAVLDPVTGERVFQTSDEDSTLDVSRRGLCLRASRPPAVGTRVLLQLRVLEDAETIELVGRARWTRVEFEPGEAGARLACRVGLEVMGGAPRALARYESSLQRLQSLP